MSRGRRLQPLDRHHLRLQPQHRHHGRLEPGHREQGVTAKRWRRLHGTLTVLWAATIVPTLIWWRQSLTWIVFMSLWANVVGHFSAWQATRAEDAANGDG